MSLTKLTLADNNLIIPGQESLVSDILAGDGKIGKNANLFLQCIIPFTNVYVSMEDQKANTG
jgi:hypothetical protein